MPSSSSTAHAWAGDLSANRSAVQHGQQLLLLAGGQRRGMRRARPRIFPAAPAGIALPVERRPRFPEQRAGGFHRGKWFQPGQRVADHLGGFVPESALSESSSKSACAFPTTSSAALVLASSLASFSFSFRSRSLSTSAALRAGRPAGLARKRRQRALLYCLTPLLDMGVIQALTAQQRPPLACAGELVVLLDDRQLVRRGEGPPLRPVSPRTPRGGHQAILPHRARHVCNGQCHVSRRSRLALLTTEVYFILMSHGSLTEREVGLLADEPQQAAG